jgi:hypothetical protein
MPASMGDVTGMPGRWRRTSRSTYSSPSTIAPEVQPKATESSRSSLGRISLVAGAISLPRAASVSGVICASFQMRAT